MHRAILYAITRFIVAWLTFHPLAVLAYPPHAPQWTKVEQKFLAKSTRQSTYPHEYFAVIDVLDHYELGKLTALRFIEWVQQNPKGVVGLASGTTPEYFIKFLDYYKNNWHKPAVQAELQAVGINQKNFPKTADLKLVQVEEMYPLSDKTYKKVSNFVVRHYAKILEIKPENLLLIDVEKTGILAEKGMNVVFMNGKVDLSIVDRKPSSQLESWQQRAIKEARAFCNTYENKIRSWHGIGFYIGTISYSGQLGFIEAGAAPDSKTHLVFLDYETAAHHAKDFGGIDQARGKAGITIGLGTISINPNAVMIIAVAGEGKAGVVRDAVENKTYAESTITLLQKYPNSRFYITDGAAKYLDDRQTEDLRVKSKHGWLQKDVEEVINYVALAERKSILGLTEKDLNKHARGRLLLENPSKPLTTMLRDTHNNLIRKIENGLKLNITKGSKILHTAPHHEDVMLAYHSLFDNFGSKHKNHLAYFTSGYNSVTDTYILNTLNRANDWWLDKEQDVIFKKPYEKVIAKFKAYYLKQDVEQMNMLDTTIAMKHLVSIYNIKNLDDLKHTIRWLKDEYFPSKQPGDLDVSQIKILKGMMRESEVERLWSLRNITAQNITHLRSKFYSGREFMRTPRYDADVVPFISLYNKIRPDVITVKDDPDTVPLITNYRVLQIIAQGLRSKDMIQNPNLHIFGYRTIWFRYQASEANTFVPVSNQAIAAQKRAYLSCFTTQRMSSFPSPFFDGDSSALMEKIQREQLAELKLLLGDDYFTKNSVAEIRDAAGFIYLNQFKINDFLRRGVDLQPAIDLEEAYISGKK